MNNLILAALLAVSAAASGEHEEASSRTGPGKAILEASAERGLKLSEAALKRLGIKTARLTNPPRVPKLSLLQTAEETSVYRLREGWFKRVHADDVKAGDVVVVAGAPLLRVAELDVLGGEEAGHDH